MLRSGNDGHEVVAGQQSSLAADLRAPVGNQHFCFAQASGIEQNFARQRTRDGKPTGFGLGWAVDTKRGRREVYHIGGQPRVSTVLYLLPDSGVAVVLLSNLEGVGTSLLDLARQVADIVR